MMVVGVHADQWGVDYIKVDGCYSDADKYYVDYPKFGTALQQSGREIVYSCSWPAYLGMHMLSRVALARRCRASCPWVVSDHD
eukprot:scaffold1300_cov317-Prasinococcus_capsulatus_cf.AAC.6